MHRRLSYAEKGKGLADPAIPPRTARVRVPAFDSSELIRKHALTVVGRLTNPKTQRIWSLIPFLSDHWNCETRPVGAYLGNGCFQFQFASETDLLQVLENQPYHFAQWMIILQRWEPTLSPTFPNQIPFWIQVQGIPLHLWSPRTLEIIAEDIGVFDKAEITNTSAKMRVFVNGLQPLIRKTTLEFDGGFEIEATLVYDKIRNHCTECYSLCHDKDECPNKLAPAQAPAISHPRESYINEDHSQIKSSYKEGPIRSNSYQQRQNKTPYSRPLPKELRHNEAVRNYNRNDESSDSIQYKNPPSTERTITARNHYGTYTRDYTRRENSRQSYRSQEYRRYDTQANRNGSQQRNPPRSLWKEKHTQQTALPQLQLERSESSRPGTQENPKIAGNLDANSLPVKAMNVAREEIRDVMTQYANCNDPTESAARKERMRQAEELGELEEAATLLVRNEMGSLRQERPEPQEEITPSRIPVANRLGPVNEPVSALQRLGPMGPPERDEPKSHSLQSDLQGNTIRNVSTRKANLTTSSTGNRKRRTLKATLPPIRRTPRGSRTIPRNEENISETVPRNEENSTRNIPKRTGLLRKTSRKAPSSSGPSRRVTGKDFRIPPSPLP